MIVLPAILDKVRIPKGLVSKYYQKKDCYIPDEKYEVFWSSLYTLIAQAQPFFAPVRNFEKKINPYFGYFGERWHPEMLLPGTFHTGVDIEGRRKTGVHAISEGVLEYSGYGAINGKYTMLSHPGIVTADGFVLHSLYLHLDKFELAFTSYQKMLRQISLNTHPIIRVRGGELIGGLGSTGASSYPDEYIHTHIQVEFKDGKGRTVFLNLFDILGMKVKQNMTAKTSAKEFEKIFQNNQKDITDRKLKKVWERYNEEVK